MPDAHAATLRAHDNRMLGMVADPELTGDLFCLAYVMARRVDFDEHAHEGLDDLAMRVLGGTEKAMELGIGLYLRELLSGEQTDVLRRHLPEVDWPRLLRWANPDWVEPERPRLTLVVNG